jgi:ubiquinone/menaquinone biosynthesis C-methylase UbiE
MENNQVVKTKYDPAQTNEITTYMIDADCKLIYVRTYPLAALKHEDAMEEQRLDDLQFVFRSFLGTNILAPITAPKKILDIGAGSGAWDVEVASELPNATVIGLDLNPVRRKDVPQNCNFVVGDINDGLKFDTDSFDLVNSRYCIPWQELIERFIRGGLTTEQWPAHMKEVYRVLKAGTGWVQCGEYGNGIQCDEESLPQDSPVRKVSVPLLDSADK